MGSHNKPRQILSIVSTLNWPPRRAVVWIVEYDIPHFFANTQIHITRLHQILNTLDRIHENSSHAWKTSKDSFEIYPRTNERCYAESIPAGETQVFPVGIFRICL